MAEPATSFAHYEIASPSLLAETPVTDVSNDNQSTEDWDQIFSYLEARLGQLRMWRYSWWVYWAQLAEFILPRRYTWLVTANLYRRGSPINQAIIDGTAGLAKDICASGLVDGLMPTTRKWFKHGVAVPGFNIDADAKMWLEDLDTSLEVVFAQSNFYNIMAQAGEDEVVFGTAPVIMYEDAEDVIRCYSPCAGEYYLATGSRLSVDVLNREFTLTVSNIVEMFGIDSCPPQVVQMWNSSGASLENEFVVAHAIEPNFAIPKRGLARGSIDVVRGFPWREVYWLKGVKTPRALSIRGFEERPFAVARWKTTSNDPYGRSPGMDALGDIKQLQQETRRKAEAIEKQVRPPMGADPTMKNEPSSILPGHITYTDTTNGKKGFWSLFDVKIDLSGLLEDVKAIQARIDRYFMVDVFMAISQMEGVQPRNDLEIAERKGEKLQRLGPVIGLWKTEFAEVLVQRAVRILERRRMLRPRPKSLIGLPLKADYIDMVTLAQMGAETASMERTFQVAGNLSAGAKAAGVPDPLRVINLDKSIRVYADKTNFPVEALFTEDEVARHDKARAQAKQQAQVPAATVAGVNAAKTLSETQLGAGNTALDALLGNRGAGAGQ